MDSERENNGHQLIETIATETIGSAVCRNHLVKDQLVPLKYNRLSSFTPIANGTLLQSVKTVSLLLFHLLVIVTSSLTTFGWEIQLKPIEQNKNVI